MNSQRPLGGGGFDRDRDIEEQQRRAIQQSEAMAHRDREQGDRQHREPYPPSAPHHSSAGSLPIHQPVANRPGAVHSPGGLLANHGGGGGGGGSSAQPMPLGAPAGPVASFGGPLQHDGGRAPPIAHSSQGGGGPGPQHQMFGVAPHPHTSVPPSASLGASSGGPQNVFGGPLQQQQDGLRPGAHQGPPPPMGGMYPAQADRGAPHGQQPILNDALTYLDQVKVQFHDQPDVYNRFLDIMKDFKSQAIDTPGVINRVSELFVGHPNLIQGFNTFLPPGYRIECGAGNDPNTIRVTTPMGTTVQHIAGRGSQSDASHPQPPPGQPFFNQRGGSNWQQQPQHSVESQSPEATFSTPAQNGPGHFNQGQGQGTSFEGPAAGHPPARGSAQIAGAAATNASAPVRSAHTPTPTGAQGAVNGSAAQQQANLERRGPVEFNHAISYVNKIKNRFQDKPEIYKQFLEILQTYQREQKPIQDVYSQVTTLFHSAPDLLEDFKQFLPESAGQAKILPGRMGDEVTPAAGPSQTPQPQMRDGQKMPPLGSFAPPASASKESKKRPRPDKQTPVPAPAMPEPAGAANRNIAGVGAGNKRSKLTHKPAGDAPAVEPTLTPVMPEPIAPPPSSLTNAEELAFFERIKKYLGNRATFTEFLKLCNLFSQNIIDRATLYQKGVVFLAANPELMTFWRAFTGTEAHDEVVTNRPEPPSGKVSLSNCRGYGPSYRLLPKRERLKPCSGRDELCNSVLNDDWASHPTWASEDSGFVAHRKNGFEEGLHRIEEERHDYDFNVEANLKCIQLLEPIAQAMMTMDDDEKEAFQMPVALAGQSTSIFKRVLKKIYGEKGPSVVNDLFRDPFTVVPIVLSRMKQKDEEWRFSQREWERVWHAQTENMHLKSLDHMGIQVKQNDKRNLSAKHLVDLIKTKHEEQRRERSLKGKAPRYQYTWDFHDKDVMIDLLRLMILYALHNGQHSATEKERIANFFETFLPFFFDLQDGKLDERLPKIQLDSGDDDGDEQAPAELTNGRGRRNGKKGDLLRNVLDPGRNGSRTNEQKEESASGSKETTPDVGSANEEDMPDAPEDGTAPDVSNERWMPVMPKATVLNGELIDPDGEFRADGFFRRPWYNLFCNQTIFVFFSILHVLHDRLKTIKGSSKAVSDEIVRLNRTRPAQDAGFLENRMNFFTKSDKPTTFWPKTLELIEEFITGEIDETRYQDVLRHYYLRDGWRIYTIQDLLKTLCRLALTCSSTDAKEKTPDLIKQFMANREMDETSYQTEIVARRYAEKCVKDGEMFVVCLFPDKSETTVRWLPREDTTFYMDEMQVRDRWQYYLSSFIRVEPTEGIPRSRMAKVVLARNLPNADNDETEIPKPVAFEEALVISICVNTSKMVWTPNTTEYFVYDKTPKDAEKRQRQRLVSRAWTQKRETRLNERMVLNNVWMKDKSQEDVQNVNESFHKWVHEGVLPDASLRNETD